MEVGKRMMVDMHGKELKIGDCVKSFRRGYDDIVKIDAMHRWGIITEFNYTETTATLVSFDGSFDICMSDRILKISEAEYMLWLLEN
jgi:hypothetical protein